MKLNSKPPKRLPMWDSDLKLSDAHKDCIYRFVPGVLPSESAHNAESGHWGDLSMHAYLYIDPTCIHIHTTTDAVTIQILTSFNGKCNPYDNGIVQLLRVKDQGRPKPIIPAVNSNFYVMNMSDGR